MTEQWQLIQSGVNHNLILSLGNSLCMSLVTTYMKKLSVPLLTKLSILLFLPLQPYHFSYPTQMNLTLIDYMAMSYFEMPVI